MTRFRCEALGFRYPAQEQWAIRDVTLEIRPGEVTWLTGALGSGTSTLLLTLAGLSPRLTGGERRGSVLVGDTDPATLTPLRAGIAYLGPDPLLQLSGVAATVRQELAVGPMNLGHAAERIADGVAAALPRLGIEALAARSPTTLSGGETQRVLLASLLTSEPTAWLLDEPFSALDREGRGRVSDLLRELGRAGHAVVVACDDADTMLPIADRLIVFEEGRPRFDGTPPDLLSGNAITSVGAGTTSAAELARLAGWQPPFPLDITSLERQLPAAASAVRTEPPSAAAGDAALDFSEVRFAYADDPPVLDGVSLTVSRGVATGLFGANGAGKSTLLRLAMALEHPSRGVVTTLGLPTAGRHPEQLAPAVGFLFQRPERQLFATSVRAECGMAARWGGWEPSRIETAVQDVLHRLGLEDAAELHPYDLPVPRRRLVALASILVTDPDLLLLDEPTAGLDARSRDRVVEIVREISTRGKAVLAITHDPVFAHEALDHGAYLERGRVSWQGPVRDLLDDVRVPRTAALAIAERLGLPGGADRRKEVAAVLRSMGPGST